MGRADSLNIAEFAKPNEKQALWKLEKVAKEHQNIDVPEPTTTNLPSPMGAEEFVGLCLKKRGATCHGARASRKSATEEDYPK